MGLDMYVQHDSVRDTGKVETVELWYGRKIGEIHGWMQRQSGIPAEEFNCERFYLTEQVLIQLEQQIAKQGVAHTAGFFFGAANEEDFVRQEIEEIIRLSRDAMLQGHLPYYFSWW